MKTSRIGPMLGLVLALELHAQSVTPATESRPLPEASKAALPVTDYSLKLKWNESKRDSIAVQYKNTSDRLLRVDAVQTSGSVFLIDYPKVIPPGGTGSFTIMLETKLGTQSDSDIIRFKTNEGEKTLKLNHDREVVATFDQPKLSWQVGEAATPKAAVLRLGYGVKGAEVKAMMGHSAKIEDRGDGSFLVTVTPKSTAKGGSFPVIVRLNPEVPGVTPIITCVID